MGIALTLFLEKNLASSGPLCVTRGRCMQNLGPQNIPLLRSHFELRKRETNI